MFWNPENSWFTYLDGERVSLPKFDVRSAPTAINFHVSPQISSLTLRFHRRSRRWSVMQKSDHRRGRQPSLNHCFLVVASGSPPKKKFGRLGPDTFAQTKPSSSFWLAKKRRIIHSGMATTREWSGSVAVKCLPKALSTMILCGCSTFSNVWCVFRQ